MDPNAAGAASVDDRDATAPWLWWVAVVDIDVAVGAATKCLHAVELPVLSRPVPNGNEEVTGPTVDLCKNAPNLFDVLLRRLDDQLTAVSADRARWGYEWPQHRQDFLRRVLIQRNDLYDERLGEPAAGAQEQREENSEAHGSLLV